MSFKLWQTADGRVLRIVDMTDDHLRNAFVHVWHTFEQRRLLGIRDPEDTMDTLAAELERRGLPVPSVVDSGVVSADADHRLHGGD